MAIPPVVDIVGVHREDEVRGEEQATEGAVVRDVPKVVGDLLDMSVACFIDATECRQRSR